MKVTRFKNCYCWNCEKPFHYLGITRHRKKHLDNRESVRISFTHGDTFTFYPKDRAMKAKQGESYS
jgi:hypothetical protein